jgi:hypothetical protein
MLAALAVLAAAGGVAAGVAAPAALTEGRGREGAA